MNVVIIGAGEIGKYVAEVLSKERINVILVDKNAELLEEVSNKLDVATRVGEGGDWQLLDELLEFSPDVLLAVTDSDESNLIACSIAKNLGYPRSMARIKGLSYLNKSRLDFARMFEVDHFISPELLVAHDIYKTIASPGSLHMETFANGAVQLRTFVVPKSWRKENIRLSDLKIPPAMMVGLIRRTIDTEGRRKGSKQIIFPHGNDCILPNDELTIIGETDVVDDAYLFFGTARPEVRSVVIIGGSSVAYHLARILEEREVDIRIIEKDFKRCSFLAETLPYSTIINDDGTNVSLLESEKISRADVIVACTSKDESNITIALLAKEMNCQRVIVTLADARFVPLIDNLGVAYSTSPRISAANRILSLLREKTISSMISLYEYKAEIVEVHISSDSKVVGIPISELGPQLPKNFLLATIQSRGRIFIAKGDRILSPGDTLIVITDPKHIPELENVF